MPWEAMNCATASARLCERISFDVTPVAASAGPIGALSVKPATISLCVAFGASFLAKSAMICLPRSLMVQLPDANSRSLLTTYLIAPCRRETAAFAELSCCVNEAFCCCNCWFWDCRSSYLLLDTQPVRPSADTTRAAVRRPVMAPFIGLVLFSKVYGSGCWITACKGCDVDRCFVNHLPPHSGMRFQLPFQRAR